MVRLIFLFLFSFLLLTGRAQYKPYHGDGIEDYLRFAPLTATYVIKAAGVEGASSWKRLLVNSAASVALTSGTTFLLKRSIHSRRPDGTDRVSFPSGHTSFAFAGATILHKEYGKLSAWISVAGYTVATVTALERVRRNRHRWSDIIVGAGLGVLGTHAGYWLGDKLTGEKSGYVVGVTEDGITLVVCL